MALFWLDIVDLVLLELVFSRPLRLLLYQAPRLAPSPFAIPLTSARALAAAFPQAAVALFATPLPTVGAALPLKAAAPNRG